ncbi:MAG TPA: hypothetical protein PLP66_02530 [Phycisphaerae bacterium]|nr:hypothetical protein [Phycisphaerae bacterium]
MDGVQADYPVLTVAMQSGGAAAVTSVLAERGLNWTAAIDADGRIAQSYGLRGVPAFVIVDPAGVDDDDSGDLAGGLVTHAH